MRARRVPALGLTDFTLPCRAAVLLITYHLFRREWQGLGPLPASFTTSLSVIRGPFCCSLSFLANEGDLLRREAGINRFIGNW